jgi:hypothetical protein
MTETYAPSIDLASIERCWPVGHDVPELITDLAALVAPWPHGTIGYFSMKGNRFDDYWIELGGDFSEQFGTFLTLPDGTRISLWFHEGAVPGAEPVIKIGSEGELEILSANLNGFLRRWAIGPGPNDLQLAEVEETPETRALFDRCAGQLLALADAAPDHPDGAPIRNLPKFMEQWQEAAIQRMAADPILKAIATLLDAHIPHDKEEWERAHMHLRVAGSRVEIQTSAIPPDYKTFIPLPERDALVPLILQAREARALEIPERGLWHSASLELYTTGKAVIKASWEFEPGFREGGRMTKAELDADLARFPRSPRYMEPWMDELCELALQLSCQPSFRFRVKSTKGLRSAKGALLTVTIPPQTSRLGHVQPVLCNRYHAPDADIPDSDGNRRPRTLGFSAATHSPASLLLTTPISGLSGSQPPQLHHHGCEHHPDRRNAKPASHRDRGIGDTCQRKNGLQPTDVIGRGYDHQEREQQHADAVAEVETQNARPVAAAIRRNRGCGGSHRCEDAFVDRAEVLRMPRELVQVVYQMNHTRNRQDSRSGEWQHRRHDTISGWSLIGGAVASSMPADASSGRMLTKRCVSSSVSTEVMRPHLIFMSCITSFS